MNEYIVRMDMRSNKIANTLGIYGQEIIYTESCKGSRSLVNELYGIALYF